MTARAWEFAKANYSLMAVAVVFAWSCWTIASYRHMEDPPGTITIRIGHWQLEPGVRDAFNIMAKEYQKLHPNVRIVQDAIPEGVYGQWSTTQFIGGTAPDIIEMGIGLPYQQLLAFFNRYCLPLSALADEPNPYNKGTEYEGVSLRKTYSDGMIAGYNNEMQEFMTIPLARFTVRIFYNKQLLKELTGLDAPPGEWNSFVKVCEAIRQKKNPMGSPYVPIVGSRYHFPIWESAFVNLATYRLTESADINRDGTVGNDELFLAVKSGRLSFTSKPIKARFAIARTLCDQFQPGFTGLTRDEGVFLFIQSRAVFITTGTWDAGSLAEQAKGKFDIGIMDYPVPRPDDPEYGELFPAARFENPGASFSFAVTRNSKHPDIAFDFLRFLASKEGNARLNSIIEWIPAIKNAPVEGFLKDFKPSAEGIYGNFQVQLGSETWIKYYQLYSLFQVNQISFDDLAAEFEPFYKEKGVAEFQEAKRNWWRSLPSNEALLTSARSKAFAADSSADEREFWRKYRKVLRNSIILGTMSNAKQLKILAEGFPAGAPRPQQYSTRAIENLRARLAVPDSPRAAP